MAGAGYKLFNTGDVLTAAQVNTYLMEQTVMVFADAAARTTALTGVVSEGMISYLKDTNAVEVYNGSAWVASDDPNAIQNTIVDAKGDLITATAADTPARLAVGANDLFLQAASGESTGLKWGGTWTSFTPTFTNITVGNGTLAGSYLKVGKMIMVRADLTWGSTTSMSGAFSQLTLPFTANPDYEIGGSITCWDFGTAVYAGSVWMSGASSVDLMVNEVGGTYQVISSMTATKPFTWTTGDILRIQIIYKAA